MEEAKNPTKKIKFEEEDRISSLPDNLIVEILSRLPSTESAIRTGTLSKRWQHLWTSVHSLVFLNFSDDKPLSDFLSLVDKTLDQCNPQLKLNKFAVNTVVSPNNYYPFESQVCNWIRYAINRKVKVLNLTLQHWYMDFYPVYELDQLIFNTSSVTRMKLRDCQLIPTGAISWINLKTLSISKVKLDEVLIANILSGSPVLENLKLENCYGYSRLDVSSNSVKNLVFSGYIGFKDTIEINAPSILSLTIRGSLRLHMILLQNVFSLVEAKLDYVKVRGYGQYGSYRNECKDEAEAELLKVLLLSVRHVKELKFGRSCSEVFSRLEAKRFISPVYLKYLNVTYGSKDDEDNQWLF